MYPHHNYYNEPNHPPMQEFQYEPPAPRPEYYEQNFVNPRGFEPPPHEIRPEQPRFDPELNYKRPENRGNNFEVETKNRERFNRETSRRRGDVDRNRRDRISRENQLYNKHNGRDRSPRRASRRNSREDDRGSRSNRMHIVKTPPCSPNRKTDFEAEKLTEFDPSLNKITADAWIKEVEGLAKKYRWSERQLLSTARAKLAGVARIWSNTQSNSIRSWEDFKTKLKVAFPDNENYAEQLLEMLSIRPRPNLPLEEYYYMKMEMLNKLGIRGKKAVDCILHGIEDRAIRIGAQGARYTEPDHLLHYLKMISEN